MLNSTAPHTLLTIAIFAIICLNIGLCFILAMIWYHIGRLSKKLSKLIQFLESREIAGNVQSHILNVLFDVERHIRFLEKKTPEKYERTDLKR